MFASIIIPTYNKAKRLELTLLSLSLAGKGKIAKEIEVIVVDDGSTDRTKEVVSKFIGGRDIKVRYVYQENKGRSAARNNGIKHARGQIIIFLDDDRLVCDDFIDQHLKYFKEPSKQNIAVLGKRMNLYISRFDQDFEDIKRQVKKDIREVFNKGREEYYWRKNQKVFDILAISWIIFTTGNVSVLRDVLYEAGLFNESFQGWGLEDTELGYRLWKNNVLFINNEKAINYHLEHPRNPVERKADESRNHELFYRLHPQLPVVLFRKYVYGEISLEDFATQIIGEANLDSKKGSTYYKMGNIWGVGRS